MLFIALLGKLMRFGAVADVISINCVRLIQPLLVLAMALMAMGSDLVISGWEAQLGSVLLPVFLVPTTLIFHSDVVDNLQRIKLFKNLAIMAGLLLVIDRDPA